MLSFTRYCFSFSIVNQYSFCLFLFLSYLQDPFLYFSFSYIFSYFRSYTYTWILLILQATHEVQICTRVLWKCNDWCPPVRDNCTLIDHFASWLLQRARDTALPAFSLLYMDFKTSFSYFSCSWKVGSPPRTKAVWNTVEYYLVWWISVAHWNGCTQGSFYSTNTYRNYEPKKLQSIFSTNKLMNTRLHLSSKYEQNETFT